MTCGRARGNRSDEPPGGERAGERGPWAACLAVLAVVLAAATPALARDPHPGDEISVRLGDLPAPHATPSAANPPRVVPPPPGATLHVPPGFHAQLFAEGLTHARQLAVAPNGDVFVAESKAGQITLLRDSDGAGRADVVKTFAKGFNRPYGMAFQPGYLYVADVDAVWRIAYASGQTEAGGPPQRVTLPGALGDGAGHWTRNLAFSPDGQRFYVAIGSRGNLEEEAPPRATIQEFTVDGSRQRSFAAGLRNPVGMAFRPGTDELFSVVNERDGMGDDLVPDFMTRVQDGGFYGWPYSWLGHPQDGFADRRPELVSRTRLPDLLLAAHSAPLGLVFYDGRQFPPEYRGSAFIALHGSWNARRPTGYVVVRVRFVNGRPDTAYQVFASGFRLNSGSPAEVWGRPAGLAVAADGSLLVADDAGQTVWRISYQ